MLRQVTETFENLGRSVEAVPGWAPFARFLDDLADGLAFFVALMWALRWFWALILVGLLLTGFNN